MGVRLTQTGAASFRQNFGDRLPQLFQLEGFANDEIHVGRWRQCSGVGSNHYDRLIRRTRLDGGCQLIAIHSGHGKVGEDQVESAPLKHGQCLLAAVGCLHLMSVILEQRLDGIADRRFVIYDQNPQF